MTKQISCFLVSSLVLAACNGDTSFPQAGSGGSGDATSTTAASGPTTGSGDSTSSATTSGVQTVGSTSTTGGNDTTGAGGAGGSGDSGAGGATSVTVGTGGGSTTGTGGSGGSAGRYGWYEAEAAPPNQLYGRAVKSKCAKTCPSMDAIKPNDDCCSAGGEVNWIVSGGHGPDPQPPDGRGGGELRFNAVSAPADGMYDVTWWYHCGNNDNFGDKNCGGQTDPPTTSAGCRPHQIIVNGTEMPGTYHFPCFAAGWGIIHAATVTLPLKAGAMNWIHVYATKPRDAADMDAIEIVPVGRGVPPLIKSNSDPIGH
jgi:hypothetical protein